jgi:hypothetical protein
MEFGRNLDWLKGSLHLLGWDSYQLLSRLFPAAVLTIWGRLTSRNGDYRLSCSPHLPQFQVRCRNFRPTDECANRRAMAHR